MRRERKGLTVEFFNELENKLNSVKSVQNVAVSNGKIPSYFEFVREGSQCGVPVRFTVTDFNIFDEVNADLGKINLTLYQNCEEFTDIFFEGIETLIEAGVEILKISLHSSCMYGEYFEKKLATLSL